MRRAAGRRTAKHSPAEIHTIFGHSDGSETGHGDVAWCGGAFALPAGSPVAPFIYGLFHQPAEGFDRLLHRTDATTTTFGVVVRAERG